MRFYRTCFNLC